MMTPEEHVAHMENVEAGLQQILASQDINEIHQIAQSLLAEEEAEEAADQGQEGGGSLRDQLTKAIGGGNEQAAPVPPAAQ